MLLKFFIEKFPLVFKKTDTKFSVSVFEFLIIIYFVLFIYEQSNVYKIMYDFILIRSGYHVLCAWCQSLKC